MHVCSMYVCIQVHECMCAHAHMCVCVSMRACVYTYIFNIFPWGFLASAPHFHLYLKPLFKKRVGEPEPLRWQSSGLGMRRLNLPSCRSPEGRDSCTAQLLTMCRTLSLTLRIHDLLAILV